MSYTVRVDSSAWQRALHRMSDGPDAQFVIEADALLSETYLQTEAIVHGQTGSLKGSGKHDSHTIDDQWYGEITFGGTSRGPIPFVTYAAEEADRGGQHDFTRAWGGLESAFAKLVNDWVDRNI